MDFRTVLLLPLFQVMLLLAKNGSSITFPTTPHPERQVQFSCSISKLDQTFLKCTCDTTSQILNITDERDDAWRKIFRFSGKISQLELASCSPGIDSKAFYTMTDLRLTNFTIRNAKNLLLRPDSLLFHEQSIGTAVTIDNVEKPFAIEPGSLGPTVTSLSVAAAKLVQFSSLGLAGIHPSAKVSISNSSIFPLKQKVDLPSVSIESLTFEDVKFDFIGSTFINLSVRRELTFRGVKMDLLVSDAIVINDVFRVIFDNSEIGFLRSHTFQALANFVTIRNTVLKEPQKKALMGFTGANSSSTLTMENVTLEDPARGTLLTGFPNVLFRNLTVDRCKCQLIMDLVEDQNSFDVRVIATLSTQQLLILLRNETFCFPKGKKVRIRPNDVCLPPTDAGYLVVVGLLIALLFLTVICTSGFAYGWHKKLKLKYDSVSKWSFIVAPVSYKQSTAVQFNEEVQYIPRPNSTVFTIDGNYVYAMKNCNERPKSIYCRRPDLVQNLHQATEEEEEDAIYSEIEEHASLDDYKLPDKSVFFKHWDFIPAVGENRDSVGSSTHSIIVHSDKK